MSWGRRHSGASKAKICAGSAEASSGVGISGGRPIAFAPQRTREIWRFRSCVSGAFDTASMPNIYDPTDEERPGFRCRRARLGRQAGHERL
jgi:hypothetical protein